MYRPPRRHVYPHIATGIALGATPNASGDLGPATKALALLTPKPSTTALDTKKHLIRAVDMASPLIPSLIKRDAKSPVPGHFLLRRAAVLRFMSNACWSAPE